MGGPPVYEDGLFELSVDPSENSLDNTFNIMSAILFPTVPSKTYLFIVQLLFCESVFRENLSMTLFLSKQYILLMSSLPYIQISIKPYGCMEL
jgi:hypothetical protein